MILEGLFGLLTGIINLIPFELPSLPNKFTTALNTLFTGIKSSLGIIDMFVDLKFWLACASAMLVIYNIKHIWNGFIFCINLIPSVNVSYWN